MQPRPSRRAHRPSCHSGLAFPTVHGLASRRAIARHCFSRWSCDLLQVPANRIGYQQAGFSLGQLKIVQEVVTLSVFLPFALYYMGEPFKFDYLWAALCLIGAVYFIFRSA